MKNFKQISLFLVLVPFLALADWTKISPTDFSIKAPPTKGSSAYTKDIRTLLAAQKNRSEDECALAATQKYPTYDAMFGSSEVLSRSETRKYKPLVSKVMKVTERVTGHYKEKYERQRPYDADERIEPCIELPGGHKSYPSSHASMATAAACVLAMAIPSRAQEIEAYGEEISNIRYIVGVHFPSDVAAGKQLGKDVCEAVAQDEDFQAELEKLN